MGESIEALREAVREAIRGRGAQAVADDLDLNIVTLMRFASGGRVQKGTLAQIAAGRGSLALSHSPRPMA